MLQSLLASVLDIASFVTFKIIINSNFAGLLVIFDELFQLLANHLFFVDLTF